MLRARSRLEQVQAALSAKIQDQHKPAFASDSVLVEGVSSLGSVEIVRN
jgi:hypothetical protein